MLTAEAAVSLLVGPLDFVLAIAGLACEVKLDLADVDVDVAGACRVVDMGGLGKALFAEDTVGRLERGLAMLERVAVTELPMGFPLVRGGLGPGRVVAGFVDEGAAGMDCTSIDMRRRLLGGAPVIQSSLSRLERGMLARWAAF